MRTNSNLKKTNRLEVKLMLHISKNVSNQK